jgi:hypothetical protein
MKRENISTLVGNTPHLRVRFGEPSSASIYVKLDRNQASREFQLTRSCSTRSY